MKLGRILGRELSRAVESGYLERLFPHFVADCPDTAIDRIGKRFGCRPSSSGTNIDGIISIRDMLHDVARETRFANALVIIAPHTHWVFDRPIVIRKGPECYLGGPCRLNEEELYTPLSFVFSEAGPLPFEWADGSIDFDEAELGEVFSVIERLNRLVYPHDWPIGVALNHRFKPLFSEIAVSTVEYQVGDDDSSACIVPADRFPGDANGPEVGQVAWHAHSDFAYGLSPEGLRLLRLLRVHLRSDAGVRAVQDLFGTQPQP